MTSLLIKFDCTGKLGMRGLRAIAPTWATVVRMPLPTSILALMGLPATVNCTLPLMLRRLMFKFPSCKMSRREPERLILLLLSWTGTARLGR
jgi:hypothetical protein